MPFQKFKTPDEPVSAKFTSAASNRNLKSPDARNGLRRRATVQAHHAEASAPCALSTETVASSSATSKELVPHETKKAVVSPGGHQKGGCRTSVKFSILRYILRYFLLLVFFAGSVITVIDVMEALLLRHMWRRFGTVDRLPISETPYEIYYAGLSLHRILSTCSRIRRYTRLQPLFPRPIYLPIMSLLPSYDFILIGAGIGGSVAAGRIAERLPNASILLIEAGSPPVDGLGSTELLPAASLFNQNTLIDWAYRTVAQDNACLGQPGRRSNWPRGKIMGGSSVLNFMIFHKGVPRDYDLWAACLDDPLWNATNVGEVLANLESFFEPSHYSHETVKSWLFNATVPVSPVETLLNDSGKVFPRGASGPLPASGRKPLGFFTQHFVKAAAQLGYNYIEDYNDGEHQTGVSLMQFNKLPFLGRRVSFFRAFVLDHFFKRQEDSQRRSSKHKKNAFHILPFAQVSRLIYGPIDAGGLRTVTGVEFVIAPELDRKFTAEEMAQRPRQVAHVSGEVLMGAGSVGTPQILLNSKIGPETELRAIFEDSNQTSKNGNEYVDLPAVGKHLQDHIFHPLLFVAKPAWRHHVMSIDNVLTPDQLVAFATGGGMLSSTGAEAQVMTEKFHVGSQKDEALPAFCAGREPIVIENKLWEVPDLQIIFYAGAPDVYELNSHMNVPIDIIFTLGAFNDWNINRQTVELFRSIPSVTAAPEERIRHFSQRLFHFRSAGTRLTLLLVLPVLLHPRSLGHITLNSSNPFEYPLIDPQYLSDDRDKKVLVKGVRFAQKLMNTTFVEVVSRFLTPSCPDVSATVKGSLDFSMPGRGAWAALREEVPEELRVLCDETDRDSDVFWEAFIQRIVLTLYHPVGTCRMGREDDPDACSDTKLLVRGFRNLRIADASAMPNLPSGNTALPTALMGEKAARFAFEKYNNSDN